jgi:hypothetical protein
VIRSQCAFNLGVGPGGGLDEPVVDYRTHCRGTALVQSGRTAPDKNLGLLPGLPGRSLGLGQECWREVLCLDTPRNGVFKGKYPVKIDILHIKHIGEVGEVVIVGFCDGVAKQVVQRIVKIEELVCHELFRRWYEWCHVHHAEESKVDIYIHGWSVGALELVSRRWVLSQEY